MYLHSNTSHPKIPFGSYYFVHSILAIGFFEHVNLIYGTVSEYCTPTTCPDMVGPGPR